MRDKSLRNCLGFFVNTCKWKFENQTVLYSTYFLGPDSSSILDRRDSYSSSSSSLGGRDSSYHGSRESSYHGSRDSSFQGSSRENSFQANRESGLQGGSRESQVSSVKAKIAMFSLEKIKSPMFKRFQSSDDISSFSRYSTRQKSNYYFWFNSYLITSCWVW